MAKSRPCPQAAWYTCSLDKSAALSGANQPRKRTTWLISSKGNAPSSKRCAPRCRASVLRCRQREARPRSRTCCARRRSFNVPVERCRARLEKLRTRQSPGRYGRNPALQLRERHDYRGDCERAGCRKRRLGASSSSTTSPTRAPGRHRPLRRKSVRAAGIVIPNKRAAHVTAVATYKARQARFPTST